MKKVKRYNFNDLVKIMRQLRGPQGCAWDNKQTHKSLLPFLIEESNEFIEAVNKRDYGAMEEELGDILHQILFHAQIAHEHGRFDICDVIHTGVKKLKRRHPHVFGNKKTRSIPQILKNWNKIKRQERNKQK